MGNNGINMGKNSNIQAEKVNFKNKVVFKKSHFVIGLTISLSIILILSIKLIGSKDDSSKVSILGYWTTETGKYIEFLSDGTMNTDIHEVKVNPDTYQILDEGYLKWGRYDKSWIQYFYTYWDIEFNEDKMILSSREDDKVINLSKKK